MEKKIGTINILITDVDLSLSKSSKKGRFFKLISIGFEICFEQVAARKKGTMRAL